METLSMQSLQTLPFMPFLIDKTSLISAKILTIRELQIQQIQMLMHLNVETISQKGKAFYKNINGKLDSSKHFVSDNMSLAISKSKESYLRTEANVLNLLKKLLEQIKTSKARLETSIESLFIMLEQYLECNSDLDCKTRFTNVQKALKILAISKFSEKTLKLKQLLNEISREQLVSDIKLLIFLLKERISVKIELSKKLLGTQITQAKVLFFDKKEILIGFAFEILNKRKNLENLVKYSSSDLKETKSLIAKNSQIILQNLSIQEIIQFIISVFENTKRKSQEVVSFTKSSSVNLYNSAIRRIQQGKGLLKEEANSFIQDFSNLRNQRNQPIQKQEIEMIEKAENISQHESEETE